MIIPAVLTVPLGMSCLPPAVMAEALALRGADQVLVLPDSDGDDLSLWRLNGGEWTATLTLKALGLVCRITGGPWVVKQGEPA